MKKQTLKITLFMIAALLACAAGLAGCSSSQTDSAPEGTAPQENGQPEESDPVKDLLQSMSTEDKVSQLFMVVPEALCDGQPVTDISQIQEQFNETPVGGLIFFPQNFTDADQTRTLLLQSKELSENRLGITMICGVDEEGASVARVAGSGLFDVPVIPSASEIALSEDAEQAYAYGQTVGSYLYDLGFNLDFAPVADILSNPENTVMQGRTFGTDPQTAADLSMAFADGLLSENIIPVFKHFPGHGSTSGDSHNGYAYTDQTLEELESFEFIPFKNAVEHGAQVIMAGHIAAPNATGNDLPATLSSFLLQDILRDQIGFQGVIITDAMNMGAITEQYASGEAALAAFEAGADLILMPEDFNAARQAILDAVESGTVSQERLNQSVYRILSLKFAMTDQESSSS